MKLFTVLFVITLIQLAIFGHDIYYMNGYRISGVCLMIDIMWLFVYRIKIDNSK